MAKKEESALSYMQGDGQGRPWPENAMDAGDEPFVESFQDINDPHQLARALMDRFRAAAEFRLPFEEEWRFAVRAWFQIPTEVEEDAWEHDHYLPIVLKHVQTAVPSLVAATLDPRGIFRMTGMERRAKNAGKANTTLVNHQAENQAGAVEAYEDMYWWAFLCGTGFVDHYWDRRREERYVSETDKDGGKRTVRKEILVADNPKVACLNPFDVYADPRGSMGMDTPSYFLRVETTPRELIQRAGKGHIDGPALHEWVVKRQPHKRSQDTEEWFEGVAGYTWSEILEEMGYEDDDDDQNGQDSTPDFDRTIVILKYIGEDFTITLGDPEHIIGFSRNMNTHGRTGILSHHYLKIPNCPYGRGLGAVLRHHQVIANENINSFLDVSALERMAPIEVDRTRANLLDEDLVIQPRAIIRTRGGDAIKPIPVPSPTNLVMAINNFLAIDADDLTGFPAQARGTSPNGDQTASAFQGLQANIQTRLQLHVRQSGRTLKRSGWLMMMLNQQYYSEAQIVSFTGEDGLDFREIKPEDLEGRCQVDVRVSSSRASPEIRAQRLAQILQVMLPLLQTGLIQQPQVRRIVRLVLEANEVEDVDLIMPKTQTLPMPVLAENELLRKNIPLPVHPQDPHDLHMRDHHALLKEMIDEGAPLEDLFAAKNHLEMHHQAIVMQQLQAQQNAASQAGSPEQTAQGASGAGVGPGGGDPTRQGANLAGSGTGGQGTPGVSAPGPAAPGRLM